jgi:branched-chain amino acid transport system substrate-binding protein
MGNVGTNQLKSWQFVAESSTPKNPAGVKFEIVPSTTSSAAGGAEPAEVGHRPGHPLRHAGQRLGPGAAAGCAGKAQRAQPRQGGLYLNYAAVDPDLTNSKCSYWHFRFDADTSMKMEALTTFMKDQPEVKKVYLINQNYSHGHQVSKYAKECCASARRADRRRRPARRWPRCATSRPTSPRSSSRAPTP